MHSCSLKCFALLSEKVLIFSANTVILSTPVRNNAELLTLKLPRINAADL